MPAEAFGGSVPRVRVLTEPDIRSLIDARDAHAAVQDAFVALARGAATLPAILDVTFPDVDGEAHVKGAHLHGSPYWSVKVATGFYRNSELGLPTTGGLSLVLSATTGHVVALLLDNGYLTELRTGAAGGVAVDLLARRSAERAAIIGAGSQARYQLAALLLVRQPKVITVASRTPAHAEAFVREIQSQYDVEVGVAASVQEAVEQADIIVTTTTAHSPIILAEWLRPGTHITAMGSDMDNKQELDVDVFKKANRIFADHPPTAAKYGEIHHALVAHAVDLEQVIPLGAVAAGEAVGRSSDSEITICDLVGIGVQDAAVANEVVSRAEAAGIGQLLNA